MLDVREVSNLCDYFVICSGETSQQIKAIYKAVVKKCSEFGFDIHHHEADETSHWLLIDFFDVILHIFLNEAREFYNLENLWSHAKRVGMQKRKKNKKNSKRC